MNDLIHQAKSLLVGDELPPFDVGFQHNEVPLSAIAASKSEKFDKPREAFKRLGELDKPAPGG